MIPANAMRSTNVRYARSSEAEAVQLVLQSAFSEFAPLYTTAAFAATVLSSAQIRQRMAEGPVWVAEALDGIVGTVGAVVRGPSLYIRGMAVVPAARGQGIGSALLCEIERFARSNRLAMLELRTTPFLTAACALYARHGFLRLAGEDSLYGTPLLVMHKPLSVSR